MSEISVVTVTRNNARGLRETLASLAALQFRPLEVVIIDGGSTDGTGYVVREFEADLPIVYSSEPDDGIYDAMNKGHRRVSGNLVHYLNAGDTVVGEPYRDVVAPCLLAVDMHDESGRFLYVDFVKYRGFGYCHQGILFACDHPDYSEQYRIAADFDLIISCYPGGLHTLPRSLTGGVQFAFGGLSSRATGRRNGEVRKILYRRLPLWIAVRLDIGITLKNLVPRAIRRSLLGALELRGQRR